MTVIDMMGRYPRLFDNHKPAHIVPVLFMRRADAELKTASARTVPRAMTGNAFQTGIVLPDMVLEGQMRNSKQHQPRQYPEQ